MIERYAGGTVPEAAADPGLADGADGLAGLEGRVSELLDRTELTQALEEIWARVRRLNRYVEESRPWELAKDEGERERLDAVLYNLAEGLRVVTLLLLPYMPQTAERLLDALGEPERALAAFGSHGGGRRVERVPPLFPKVDAPEQ
jgi:methionyl-tRNA synthetase